jgi:hypothetical protein
MVLTQLREAGINTEIITKAKISKNGMREIQLHDLDRGPGDRAWDQQ